MVLLFGGVLMRQLINLSTLYAVNDRISLKWGVMRLILILSVLWNFSAVANLRLCIVCSKLLSRTLSNLRFRFRNTFLRGVVIYFAYNHGKSWNSQSTVIVGCEDAGGGTSVMEKNGC